MNTQVRYLRGKAKRAESKKTKAESLGLLYMYHNSFKLSALAFPLKLDASAV
jgi:hypothetical protein